MKTVGIICEYNPFHLGHQKQISSIRRRFGSDCGIVCLMSGSFVQRGMPAIIDKSLRAGAAVAGGADLVLELPVTYALSSAEGFAAGGVRILSGFCDCLCFGTETGTGQTLLQTAASLLRPDFSPALREELARGFSFPAARQAALEKAGGNASLLKHPNDILAVEYCKAILAQESTLEILPITRQGSYHNTVPDPENPSATALRALLLQGGAWRDFIPEAAVPFFENAPVHTLAAGERAILARLRSMCDADFEALPYGSEGLWRRLMHASRSCSSLDEILTAVKSKRYTRSRLDRMVMCAFLGITGQMLEQPTPYTRVLALNDTGKILLKKARTVGSFPHAGQAMDDPYWILEQRCSDLYGLFCTGTPEKAGTEPKRRLYIQGETSG